MVPSLDFQNGKRSHVVEEDEVSKSQVKVNWEWKQVGTSDPLKELEKSVKREIEREELHCDLLCPLPLLLSLPFPKGEDVQFVLVRVN